MDNRNFQLISSILRGRWLVQKEWAEDHLVLFLNLLEGKGWPMDLQTKFLTKSDNDASSISGPATQIENIRVIGINGPISKYGGMCSYGTMDYIQAVQEAYIDDSVEGLLYNVDCPGGDSRSLGSLFDIIHSQYKPSVAYIRDTAASGGYFPIAGCNYIIASQPTDQIGSIGVYTTIRDYSERMKAMGVSEREIYSRLSSEKNHESRMAEAGDTSALEDVLDVVAQDFIDRVKLGRGEKLNLLSFDPFKGKTYFAENKLSQGDDALSIGLIDEIGSFALAFEKAQSLADERRIQVNKSFISNNNSINMFGDKYPLMTALRGVAAADVTEESLNALNAQLAEKGIAGVVAVRTDWVTEAENLAGQIAAKDTTIASLTASAKTNASKLEGLQTSMSEKDGQIATLQARVEELGKLPATAPASPVKREGEALKAENPFLTEADIELAQIKASMLPSVN